MRHYNLKIQHCWCSRPGLILWRLFSATSLPILKRFRKNDLSTEMSKLMQNVSFVNHYFVNTVSDVATGGFWGLQPPYWASYDVIHISFSDIYFEVLDTLLLIIWFCNCHDNKNYVLALIIFWHFFFAVRLMKQWQNFISRAVPLL